MKKRYYSIRGYAILMYGKAHQERSIKRWLNKLDHALIDGCAMIEDNQINKDFIDMKKNKSKKMVR